MGVLRRHLARVMAALVLVLVLTNGPALVSAGYDWPQFNGGPQHMGNNTQEIVITPDNARTMRRAWTINLPTNVDGTPVSLHGVQTPHGPRDLLFVTTTGGYIFALDQYTGETIWTHVSGPGSCRINSPDGGGNKGQCFTTSSPAVDPNRQFVYSYGLDGYVHRYAVGTGEEVTGKGWPEITTKKPYDEKGSSALSIATARNGTSYLYVTHAGYPLDRNTYGDYTGSLTTINLTTGDQKVFNSLCSDKTWHLGVGECAVTRGGVWARPGVMYDPDLDRIFIATGNGPFDPGKHYWSDSVLALNPDGTGDSMGNPLDSYTPTNYAYFEKEDVDLGSSLVTIINAPPGFPVRKMAVQPGKDGNLRLLNLANLSGKGKAGQTGGELDFWPVPQNLGQPTFGGVRTQPITWTDPTDGSVWLFVANLSGISAARLTTDLNKAAVFHTVWQAVGQGSEGAPVLVNNVLFWAVNDALRAFDPRTGQVLWQTADNGPVHWQAPVAVDGVLYLPDHAKHLSAYAPPPTVSKIEVPGGSGPVTVKVTDTGFTPATTIGLNEKGAGPVSVTGPTLLSFTADADTVRTASVTLRNGVGQTVVAEAGGKGTTAPPAKPAGGGVPTTANGALIIALSPPDGGRQVYSTDSGDGCGPVLVPLEPFSP